MFAAELTASDLAAIVVAIASVVAVVLLVFVVVTLNRTLTTVRLSVEELRRQSVPVLEDLHRTLVTANGELERIDGLIDSASSVTATVDSASRLAYLVFSNPVMKAIAAGSGVARAARSLRRR